MTPDTAPGATGDAQALRNALRHALTAALKARDPDATSGPGSTEATRRQLSSSELRDIIRAQIDERTREADRYDTLGQADAAERLRRQARTLAAYL